MIILFIVIVMETKDYESDEHVLQK